MKLVSQTMSQIPTEVPTLIPQTSTTAQISGAYNIFQRAKQEGNTIHRQSNLPDPCIRDNQPGNEPMSLQRDQDCHHGITLSTTLFGYCPSPLGRAYDVARLYDQDVTFFCCRNSPQHLDAQSADVSTQPRLKRRCARSIHARHCTGTTARQDKAIAGQSKVGKSKNCNEDASFTILTSVHGLPQFPFGFGQMWVLQYGVSKRSRKK